MRVAHFNCSVVTLLQGEFRISDDPMIEFATILGSCVAVCMFDDQKGVGGINHFLLPGVVGGQDESLKYGVNSMELLINGLMKSGASRTDMKAKLFGGSSMSGRLSGIGESNAEFAKSFLEQEAIPVISESLGGRFPRNIRFHPASGAARQLFVPAQEVVEEVLVVPKAAEKDDSITLF